MKPEKKSLLADCAYQGGDIPKKWLNDMGYYYNGYNKAHKEWEVYHKQEMDKIKEAMSVEKIQKIMYKTEDDYELGETNSLHIAIAKAIHKLIGK